MYVGEGKVYVDQTRSEEWRSFTFSLQDNETEIGIIININIECS